MKELDDFIETLNGQMIQGWAEDMAARLASRGCDPANFRVMVPAAIWENAGMGETRRTRCDTSKGKIEIERTSGENWRLVGAVGVCEAVAI